MGERIRFSREVREQAIRLVQETASEHASQWAAICSIAAKIGSAPETLRKWVRQADIDSGRRTGLITAERERIKELERENRELKRADEILRKAAAFFGAPDLSVGPVVVTAKNLVAARLKRSAMRWSCARTQRVLDLRAFVKSERWEPMSHAYLERA